MIAVGVKEVTSVWESGAVGVVVNGPYSWFISSAVTPGQVDGVTHAAVSQPAGVTAVEATLPGQVELPDRGQLSSQSVAVSGSRCQAQLVQHAGVKHFT